MGEEHGHGEVLGQEVEVGAPEGIGDHVLFEQDEYDEQRFGIEDAPQVGRAVLLDEAEQAVKRGAGLIALGADEQRLRNGNVELSLSDGLLCYSPHAISWNTADLELIHGEIVGFDPFVKSRYFFLLTRTSLILLATVRISHPVFSNRKSINCHPRINTIWKVALKK